MRLIHIHEYAINKIKQLFLLYILFIMCKLVLKPQRQNVEFRFIAITRLNRDFKFNNVLKYVLIDYRGIR